MTAPDFKALGTALAYKHVVPFLELHGGLQPVEEIYGHIAIEGLKEGSITVQQVRNKDYWREFTQGIGRVNPSVWSSRQEHAYGPALPIVCGEPTPRGYWATVEFYSKPVRGKRKLFGGLFAGLARNAEVEA